MKTRDIGILSEKVLVFGGVYSNYQALQRMQGIAKEMNIPPQNVICTGDIMGYCAQPNECLDLIRSWGVHGIAGNVELNVRDGVDDCGCNFENDTRCDVLSRQWYPYTLSETSDAHKQWLHSLPHFLRFEYVGKKVLVLHGGFTDVSQFIFKSTDWQVKADIFEKTESDVILGGHCGLPFSDVKDEKYWLNPGVIGMPANDGTDRVWCMVLDDQGLFLFEHLPFTYDHQPTSQLMKEKKLTPSYAETLSTGLWDNMDILPEEERKLRGVGLALATLQRR